MYFIFKQDNGKTSNFLLILGFFSEMMLNELGNHTMSYIISFSINCLTKWNFYRKNSNPHNICFLVRLDKGTSNKNFVR